MIPIIWWENVHQRVFLIKVGTSPEEVRVGTACVGMSLCLGQSPLKSRPLVNLLTQAHQVS